MLDDTIDKVAQIDQKRAQAIYSFYIDYQQSIANVARTVKKKGYACYVVGNRTVKNTTLPTDKITQLLFEEHGFQHHNTFIRAIPNKRMPSKNSPSNKVGKKATTMNREYIVVMQKN